MTKKELKAGMLVTPGSQSRHCYYCTPDYDASTPTEMIQGEVCLVLDSFTYILDSRAVDVLRVLTPRGLFSTAQKYVRALHEGG